MSPEGSLAPVLPARSNPVLKGHQPAIDCECGSGEYLPQTVRHSLVVITQKIKLSRTSSEDIDMSSSINIFVINRQ